MAKYLTDELELQSVANAIRAKGGTSGSLAFPSGFVSAITEIASGGNIEEDGNGNLTFSADGDVIGKMPLVVNANGTYTPPTGKAYTPVTVNVPSDGGSVPAKAVNFRDYDGTITNSYTKAEFLALSAMPDNPSHDGLIAQGWNWSLADAQACVAECGWLEIGQMYITDDGKTRVYIHLEQGRTSPMLGCCPNGTVDVDWGDGTEHDTLTGTSINTVQWTPNHAYAAPGDYVIKLTVTGSMGFYGSYTTDEWSGILRHEPTASLNNFIYINSIYKVELGNGINALSAYAFYMCNSLNSITMHKAINVFGAYSLSTTKIKYITIPLVSAFSVLHNNVFRTCYFLVAISFPQTGISLYNNNNYEFGYCTYLERIIMNIGQIGQNMFNGCRKLNECVLLDNIVSINENSFANCKNLKSIHLLSTTPPTLTNINAFNNIPSDCIIYVPYSSDHSILEAYKTATNWSTYASKIQEEPV